ncbi:MAG: GNAT family N-acetyltransferase [Candidatus Daviesbacteria bacterium]|nr:GNAT family N-acetyltransferase [Candidatus Daviesbacteria bacterium]
MEKNMIRKAKKSDLNKILRLLEYGVASGKVLTRSKSDILQSINNFFVCVEDNQVIGCASLDIYSSKLAEIRSLVVDACHQRKGIGSLLVQTCLMEAKKQGIFEVLVITDKDQFFKGLGFKKSIEEKRPMFLKLDVGYNKREIT